MTTPVAAPLSKGEIQRYIEKRLKDRLSTQGLKGKRALQEQAAFMAGAGAALQAVFDPESDKLTSMFSPSWFIDILRGELIEVRQ